MLTPPVSGQRGRYVLFRSENPRSKRPSYLFGKAIIDFADKHGLTSILNDAIINRSCKGDLLESCEVLFCTNKRIPEECVLL